MIRDAVTRAFLAEIGAEVSRSIEGLTNGSFEQLAQVARLQGRIDGLRTAVTLLEKVIEEQTKE